MTGKIGELRATVFTVSAGRCEWCRLTGNPDTPAVELAHITSRGMGGSKRRDTVENTFAACWYHARISDYEHQDAAAEWERLTGSTRYDPGTLREAIATARRAAGWAT